MNENRFTPNAEEVLRLAQESAQELGHGYVGSEHLLLGLLRREEGLAYRVLTEYGLTDEMVTGIVQRSMGRGNGGLAPAQGLTPRAKSVVELAVAESRRMSAPYIGTEHLLMGILREGSNMALRILRTVGVDPRHMYADLQKKLSTILSQISGVGKVEILLTEAIGSDTIYQMDTRQNLGDADTVIVMDRNREETGLVKQILPPVYRGAVVVCQGADSASVRLSVVDAVKSVTGLSSDCITVLKMK